MKNLTFLLVLLTLLSCKGGGGGGASSSLNFASILGDWSEVQGDYSCEQDEDQPSLYVSNFTRIEDDGEKLVSDAYVFYSDSDCTSPLFYYAASYTPTISGTSMTLNLDEEYISSLSDAYTTTANSNTLCGINDWQTNEPRPISETVCSEDATETISFTNINKSGSTLTFSYSGQNLTYYLVPQELNQQ